MLKYLKRLFHRMIVQGRKFLSRNVQPIDSREEIEDDRNTLHRVETRELSRLTSREKKSLSNNENYQKNCHEGHTNIRKKIPRFYVKGICEIKNSEKREIVRDNNEEKHDISEEMCRCENCAYVATLNECGVCLESLQKRGVRTCAICANIVCSICAGKFKNCPFCRSLLPMQKNRSIERLLDGLFLPCRNARSGCRKMLNSEMRSRHEASCAYTSISCPVSGACRWNGSPESIIGHMRKAHDLKPLEDQGLTIEISSFRRKTMTREGECTIYLSCYNRLFAVKVMLRRRKLILSFSQTCYATRITEKIIEKKYGVWIKLKVGGKRIRGVLPFDGETRQIEIKCETVRYHQDDTSRHDDNVKVEIFIREIKEDERVN